MAIQLHEAARITRTSPTSPTLSLTHHNVCPAQEGRRCTCDASWMLRPVAPQKAVQR
jgi:hypothetical protein